MSQPATDQGHTPELSDLSADEVHCLICAMAGNFPKRFTPVRMDLLRKLAKAHRRAASGDSGQA